MKKVYLFLLIILLFGCSSVKKIENPISLDYTQEDVAKNEIETIRKLKSSEPTKALWRSYLLGNKDILQECIDHCLIQLDLSIEEKDYFEAKKYVISLESVDVKVEKDKKNLIESFYATDIPGFGKNSLEPKTIEDCVNATVTILVDKGLAIKNGIGFADGVVGSGFFIDERGYIITNYHVIKDLVDPTYEGFSRLYVKLQEDLDTKIPAKVIGYDSILDLALIKAELDPKFVLNLGSSEKLKVGTEISAIGAPIGLDGTLTTGVISTAERKLNTLGTYFQVDAAINSGNSGGPLIDKNHNVQAVVFAGIPSFQGLNFAIPVEYLWQILPLMYKGDEVYHSWIGAYGHTKRKGKEKVGLEVQYLLPGGVAHRAGLKENDVIISVNGKSIKTIDDFQFVLMGHNVGTVLKCKYISSDENLENGENPEKETLIYLEKRSNQPVVEIYKSDYYSKAFIPFFGLELIPTSSSRKKSFMVKNVIRGTAADELGFSENDKLVVGKVKLDDNNKYLIAQISTQRKKKGFMDISLMLSTPYDSPYYF